MTKKYRLWISFPRPIYGEQEVEIDENNMYDIDNIMTEEAKKAVLNLATWGYEEI